MKFQVLFVLFLFFIAVFAHGDGEPAHKPEDPAPGVIDVTSALVDTVFNGENHVLAEFYAPWCGHCKNLAPEYHTLGAAMDKAKPSDVIVAKVNCVAEANICSKYSVSGYPTLKYFPKGSTTPEDYNGGRTADDFVDFLNQKANARLKILKPVAAVTDLNPSNFDSVALDPEKDVLVEFYAPWCGHCKQLAPKYELLAKAFVNDPSVVIAKFDADKHRDFSSKYGVSGFPTLKWFGKNSKSDPKTFNRGTEVEMLKAVNELAGTHRELSGLLDETAGLIPSLTNIVKTLAKDDLSAAKRKQLLSDAKTIAEKQVGPQMEKIGQYYVKAMEKWIADHGYPSKELDRLSRIMNSGSAAANMLDEFQIRRNILSQF